MLFLYGDHSDKIDHSEIPWFVEAGRISHSGHPAEIAGGFVEVFVDPIEITPVSGFNLPSANYTQINFEPGIPSFGGD